MEEINEKESFDLEVTLKNKEGENPTLSEVSIWYSIINLLTGEVIKTTKDTPVTPTTNPCLIHILPADNVLQDASADYEYRKVIVEWTYNGGNDEGNGVALYQLNKL
jgi:hypothetical protein